MNKFLVVTLLMAFAIVTACEPDTSEQESLFHDLVSKGPWKVTQYTMPEGTETISNSEVIIEFESADHISPRFALTNSPTYFTVTNSGYLPNPHALNDVFPASGTYKLASDDSNTLNLYASGSTIPLLLTDVVVDESNGNKSLSFKYQGVVVEGQPIEVIVHAVPK